MNSDPVVVLAIVGAVTCVVLAVAVVSLPWASERRAEQPVLALSGYRPFNLRTADAVVPAQVHGRIPAFDKLLAQELLRETDDELLLARANIGAFDTATWQPLLDAARGRYSN